MITKTYCVRYSAKKGKWKVCLEMTGMFGLSYVEARKLAKQKRLEEC